MFHRVARAAAVRRCRIGLTGDSRDEGHSASFQFEGDAKDAKSRFDGEGFLRKRWRYARSRVNR